MFEDAFGKFLPADRARFIEPPWKAILTSKGILPILWEMAPGHPNLLESYFEDDPRSSNLGASYVPQAHLLARGTERHDREA
jgi:glutathionylspermidine synthase